MELKKSPFAYVCDHKNCFTRHMTIPVVLRDCYDPKQTCKHTRHGHKLRKKSFRPLEVVTGVRKIAHFS